MSAPLLIPSAVLAPSLSGLAPMLILAVEIGVIVALFTLLQWARPFPCWRRTVGHATILALLGVTLLELGDVRARLRLPSPDREARPSEPLRGPVAGEHPQLQPAFLARVAEQLAESAVDRPAGFDTARGSEGEAVALSVPAASPGDEGLATPAVVLAVCVWLGGMVMASLYFLLGRAWLILFCRRHGRAADPSVVAAIQDLSVQLALRRPVVMLELPRLTCPVAFGLVRPVVAVPTDFARHARGQQDVMLAHELAHLRNHDPFWYLVADAVTAVLWWHPAVWWARRQLHIASEAAADEASLLIANGPSLLAECLVSLGNRIVGLRPTGGLGVTGFRSDLGRRVQRLLELSPRSTRRLAGWQVWMVRGTSSAAVVGCCLTLVSWLAPLAQPLTGRTMNTFPQAWKSTVAVLSLVALSTAGDVTAQDSSPTPPAGTPAGAAEPEPESPPGSAVINEQFMKRYGIRPQPSTGTPAEPGVAPAGMDPALMRRYGLRPPGPSSPRGEPSPLAAKLDRIRLNEVEFDGLPLPEVLAQLSRVCKDLDPEKKGVNFLINPNRQGDPAPQIDPTTGMVVAVNEPVDMNSVIIRFNLPLRDIRMRDVLEAVTKVADRPISYAVTDYAVVFSPGLQPGGMGTCMWGCRRSRAGQSEVEWVL